MGPAAVSFGTVARLAYQTLRNDGGTRALLLRSIVTTVLVFCFFEVLPHYRVGVSEVHFIFGALLYLIFGAGPTAIGLALGLLGQSLLFETADLPLYFINVTTIIIPLWVVAILARRIVRLHTPYVQLKLLAGAVAVTRLSGRSDPHRGAVVALRSWLWRRQPRGHCEVWCGLSVRRRSGTVGDTPGSSNREEDWTTTRRARSSTTGCIIL